MKKMVSVLFLVFCCFGVAVVLGYGPAPPAPRPTGDTYSDCINRVKTADCRNHRSIRGPRTYDGTCNNLRRPTLGAANTPVTRILRPKYADGHDIPRGFPGYTKFTPTPHEISGAVFKAIHKNKQKANGLSTIFMTFGQFLDHDMSFSPHADCKNPDCRLKSAFKYPCFPIKFTNSGHRCTGFGRSAAVCPNRPGQKVIRLQMNALTSFIDGSGIYGNSKKMARRLRKLDGSGEMKVDSSNNLPIDHDAECMNNPAGCSLAGDERVDENIALYGMHTIWVRHHNVIVKKLKKKHAYWSGNRLFEAARKINVGILQNIAFEEFLGHVVDLPRYSGYRSYVKPSIFSAFSSAAFRFGHSLVPNEWAVMDNNYDKKTEPIKLQNSFFNTVAMRRDGVEGMVFGLLANQSQAVDTEFAHGIKDRLFVKPGKHEHSDLTALNIQRGRDHGVPSYGWWRKNCRLWPKIHTWRDLEQVMSKATVNKFRKLYKHPHHIDLFAAGVAEKPTNGKIIGPTFQCLFRKQLTRVRDGDRFFYLNRGVYTYAQRRNLKSMTLSRVLCDTMKGMVSIQKKAFKTGHHIHRSVCDSLPKLNMKYW